MKRFSLVFCLVLLLSLFCTAAVHAEAATECTHQHWVWEPIDAEKCREVCADCGYTDGSEYFHWRDCTGSTCGQCGVEYTGDHVGSHSYSGNIVYETDDTQHWFACPSCGEVIADRHYKNCGESKCNACGIEYDGENVSHEIDWSKYSYDSESHWYACANCDEKQYAGTHERYCDGNTCNICNAEYTGDNTAHNVNWDEYKFDDNSHWFECVGCGEKHNSDIHMRKCNASTCTICGAPYTGDTFNHDWNWDELESDEEYHWMVCRDCGEITNHFLHNRVCNSTEDVCSECGVPYSGDNWSHHNIDWDTFVTDGESHWYDCADCDEQINKSEHRRNCNENTCTECGAEYTGERTNHNFNWNEWKNDAENHWQECVDCGERINESYHSRLCNGSTCVNCGIEYTGDNYGHDWNWDEPMSDADSHWIVCKVCGEITNQSQHYRRCNATEEVCAECGVPYTGDRLDHFGINWDEAEGNSDMHWYWCSDCGEKVNESNHWRNCNENVCGECGVPYDGDSISHRTDWNNWLYDAENHWLECEFCGPFNLHHHSRLCDEDVCETCGMEYTGEYTGHAVDSANWMYDETKHWKVCEGCGLTAYENEHWRRCTESVCADCGIEYTGGNVGHIVDWDAPVIEGDYHWFDCANCDEKVNYDRHRRQCNGSVCAVCGIEYTLNDRVSHRVDWSYYESDGLNHWRACQDCGEQFEVEPHHRDCNGNVCEACGAEYTGENVVHQLTGQFGHNESSHWSICEHCDEQVDPSGHVVSCEDATMCVFCKQTLTGDDYPVMHAETEKGYDEFSHWEECVKCGEMSTFGDHWHICENLGTCMECGATDVNFAWTDHWGEIKSTYDEKTHQVICCTCGEIIEEGSHGSDCQDPTRCFMCGATYDGSNVIGHPFSLDEIAPSYDENQHWYHCPYCDTDVFHSEHFAQCPDTDKCAECGATDVIISWTNHVALGGYEHDEGTHWQNCYTCGEKAYVGAHWFTCQSPTVCTGCGYENPDNLKIDHYWTNDNVNAGAYHCKICQDCGAEYSIYEHSASCAAPNLCTVCGATGIEVHQVFHESIEWEHDENYHWGVCTTCGETIDKGNHWGECNAPNYCWDCGAKDITLDYMGHCDVNWGAYLKDETSHWYICNFCGGEAYKEEHYQNCNEPGFCFSCSLVGDFHTEHPVLEPGWKNDETQHWRICVLCDEEVYKYEHYDDAAAPDGKCDTCGAAVVSATPLEIVTQPTSVIVPEGKKATTTVEATGDGLTYQWYYANKGSSKFYKASITTATYTVSMTSARAGRQIYCIVTDAYGNSEKTDTVTLEMATPLEITQQPTDVTVASGKMATVKVAATGDDLSYQWYYANKGSSKFYKASITTDTYSVSMNSTRAGRQIYCIVTDGYGITVKSDTVTLNMAKPVEITQQPSDVTVASGKNASTKVVAEGDGLTYQWYYANKGSTKFSKASITGDTYTVAMNSTRAGRQIYCLVKDAYGNSVKSNTVTLNMEVTLKITQQPSDVTVASGKTASTKVVAEGEGLTYQWYYANKGSTKFSKASITKATYSVSMSSARDGRRIYCVVKDANGNSVKSETVTLSMEAELKITQQPSNVSVASGKTASTKVVATGEGLTYQWYYANKGSTKFSKASITKATYSVSMTSARDGRRIYCVVTDANGNTVKSNTVTLSIAK